MAQAKRKQRKVEINLEQFRHFPETRQNSDSHSTLCGVGSA